MSQWSRTRYAGWVMAMVFTSSASATEVVVRLDPDLVDGPITGRAYVAFAVDDRRPPIQQAGILGAPLFGIDVTDHQPGDPISIGETSLGHPIASLGDLPPGRYNAQPFFNRYTRFERADGHTLWLHEDQGEGQSWRRSPGNLFGAPVTVTVGPEGGPIELVCDQEIPPIEFPADTDMVKRFRIRSEKLSAFWGRDVELGATVLLPRGYDDHPDARYPVCYIQGHYSLRAPGGYGRGRSFDDKWNGPDTPRFLFVTFQHPTPYYDDSYAVNSANNGPYGDALIEELIPEVERRFRAIGEPWARTLTGGSTGGWSSLALQIFYPDLFNGVWSLCPDALDFRAHQIVDIYEDPNAYFVDHGFIRVERPTRRGTDGSIREMMKDENRYELVVGNRSRSGGQWDIWEATYGPVGDDGYPERLWDKWSGEIDHDVAAFWRDNYDLRHVLERDWGDLGPRLVGKIHIYVGDMDNYYLNNGVELMEKFLESTRAPYYGGLVEYGDGEGHCYGPGYDELIELMTRRVESTAPAGADLRGWRHGAGR